MHSEILYELIKNRVADLHEDAAVRRSARQARDARDKEHTGGRWPRRAVLGRRQRS